MTGSGAGIETTLPTPPYDAPMSPRLRQSILGFLALMLGPVAVKLLLVAFAAASPGFRSPSQTAIFAWPALGVLTLAGLLGVILADRVALPITWDPTADRRERFTRPVVWGLAMGLLSVIVDLLTGWTKTSAAALHVESIHIAWPQSLAIYPAGAVIVNVIYYLVPIPLLVWLLTRVVSDPRWHDRIYWAVGVGAALVEPITQGAGNGLAQSRLLVIVFGAQDLLANLLQVRAFKKAGFGASVLFRVAFYLVWHVGYGLTGA